MSLKDEIMQSMVDRIAVLFERDPDEITAELNFEADLEATSANLVQVLSAIEDEYEIMINFHYVRQQETLGELVDYIVSQA